MNKKVLIILTCFLVLASCSDKNTKETVVTTPEIISSETVAPPTLPVTVTTSAPAVTEPVINFSPTANDSVKKYGFRFESTAKLPARLNFWLKYSDAQGVFSFRGGNLRQNAAYGTLQDTVSGITKLWNIKTGSTAKGEGGTKGTYWTGNGWTGQPLLVKWSRTTKSHMNLEQWAKDDDELVEAIYAAMDGNIYFIDIKSGEATRPKMKLGVPFKGSGSIDPRGYPLLYLGQGDNYSEKSKSAKGLIINLLDCSVVYSFGQKDSYAKRSWTAFDSSALVSNDTLVYPCENGVVYYIKLNSSYDEVSGRLEIAPSISVKTRYGTSRGYTVGYEGSAAAFGKYIIFTENSGSMHCIDTETMQPVWVFDTWDDTNSSPAFSIEGDKKFIYIGCSLENKGKLIEEQKIVTDISGNEVTDKPANLLKMSGKSAFFKITAEPGEEIWHIEQKIVTTKQVTGGVMTSAAIGKDYVYMSFATLSGKNVLSALSKETGDTVWSAPLEAYTWSSPIITTTKSGAEYVVQCDTSGNVYVFKADTGEQVAMYETNSMIEASPAAFNDIVVVGTKTKGIFGFSLQQ
ncbi:MAG: PQQ-binding-like beta-propeller repeat protein [Ruminococcus sp.]|jgi:outer membrane protein assembly factor BamB|nr:PQQ-binding-like beta-propeller repeat protein [Ruminococcus sp.]